VKAQKNTLKETIIESHLGIVLIGLIVFIFGIINIMINDSKNEFSEVPILLFIIPSIIYFFIAYQTKKLNYSSFVYLVIGGLYLVLTSIEFYLGYDLNKLMRQYFSEKSDNSLSYILQLVPLIYQIFRFTLVIIFFRIWNLLNKYDKLNVA